MSVTHSLAIAHPITIAQSLATVGKEIRLPDSVTGFVVEANFTYGSGGTTAKAFIQTTLDGTNWIDIMCFAFLLTSARAIMATVQQIAIATPVTPAVGALADNTSVNGIIGRKVRVQVVTTGTYAGGTTLDVTLKAKMD